MGLLIKNIGCLAGILAADVSCLRGLEMDRVESIHGAWLLAEGEDIAAFGAMDSCPDVAAHEIVDACGALVTPAFCDAHTHIVWAGDRSGEFVDKIKGLSYEEIARRGGGILNSADRLAEASDDELYIAARRRLDHMTALGTCALEIKTGYGLTTESELKMLRVIERLRRDCAGLEIRITFLGAHAVGREFAGRQGDYVDYVISDMMPQFADKAEFVDVFCDEGFFTPDETDRILAAGQRYGLRPKIHANELACSGGVQVGVARGAVSVDHLERIGDEEIRLLASSSTIATMLPGASFFSNLPFGPAREAISGGCAVALASDYNPGSTPSGSMPFVWSLGCIRMRLTPEQAFNAITINGAAAMDLSGSFGSVTVGKKASLIIWAPEVTKLAQVPYAYTDPRIVRVIRKGK